jgi:transposase
VPGGVCKEITAGQAARIVGSITPPGAVQAARCELATAVPAAGTSLTGLFAAGPVIAAAVLGDVRTVARFPNRDHFAACNGTAPIEVSSGGRKICRLSRRGNRRLNHAIHMVAVTQIRHRHSPGRACYDRKLAEARPAKRPCAA